MLGDLILQRAAEALRKLRNTARFMLGNLAGFLPPEHAVGYADLMLLDRYMLHKLAEACAAITAAYDECAPLPLLTKPRSTPRKHACMALSP